MNEDNLAIVVLDALSYHEWVSEDKFAEKLRLSARQIRKILQQLERQGFVVREHRRERKRGNAVHSEMDYDEKGRTVTYVNIDYPLMFDMLRLRLHLAKKRASDRIDDGNVRIRSFVSTSGRCRCFQRGKAEMVWSCRPLISTSAAALMASSLCASKSTTQLASPSWRSTRMGTMSVAPASKGWSRRMTRAAGRSRTRSLASSERASGGKATACAKRPW